MKLLVSATNNIAKIASDKLHSMTRLQVLRIKHFSLQRLSRGLISHNFNKETDCDMRPF